MVQNRWTPKEGDTILKNPCRDSNTAAEKKDRPTAIGHSLLLNHKVTSIAKPEVDSVA